MTNREPLKEGSETTPKSAPSTSSVEPESTREATTQAVSTQAVSNPPVSTQAVSNPPVSTQPVTTRTLLIEAAVALLLAVLTWPVMELGSRRAILGIDPSWRIALHQIRIDRLAWGPEVVNTLGPLGFVAYPMLSGAGTAWQSILTFWGFHIVAVIVTLTVLRGYLPLWGAAVATYLVTMFGWNPMFEQWLMPEACAALFALVCFDRISRRVDGRPSVLPLAAFAALLGVCGAILMAVKLSAGLQTVVVGASTVFALSWPIRNWRHLIEAAAAWFAALIVTYLAIWILLGQSIGAVVGYVRAAIAMAGAYAGNMGATLGVFDWALPVGLVLVVAFAGFAAWRWHRAGNLGTLFALAPVAFFLYFTFKFGFVRTDYDHTIPFLLSLAVAGLGLLTTRARFAIPLGAVIVVALVLGWTSGRTRPPILDQLSPAQEVAQAGDTTRLLLDRSYRTKASAGLRRSSARRIKLGEDIVNEYAGRRVHIDPVETSMLWIYPQFKWGAPPVFQSYLAYTNDFDERNAEWLRDDATAPDVIFTERWAGEGRDPLLESPEYKIEMICRYTKTGAVPYTSGRRESELAIVERGDSRCGPIDTLETYPVAMGEALKIPKELSCDGLLVYSVEGFDAFGERIRTTLYKDAIYSLRYGPRSSRRFVAGSANQFHLLPDERIPEWASDEAPARELLFSPKDSSWLTPTDLQVTFGCLPYEPES